MRTLSNTRSLSTGTSRALLGVLALCLLFFACGDKGSNNPDGGLPGDGTSLPDSGNTTERITPLPDKGTPPGPINPLSANEFAYVHYPKNDSIGHIKIYDLNTKQSRLLTDLDNKTTSPEISISPDRRWLAFRAFFRPNTTDLAQGISIPALWVISVDGKQLRRITDTIPNGNKDGAACTANAQCATTGYCNTALGKCSLRNYTMGLGRPTWSADSKTLYSTLSTHWMSGTQLTGGSSIISVPLSGGLIQIHNNTSGCAQVTHLAAHPKENKLAAVHSVCNSGKPGLHTYTIPPGQPSQLFDAPNISTELNTPSWAPDGSGIFFVSNTTWDLNNDGKPDAQGIGIAAYDINKKQFGAILPPLKEKLFYSNFSISPDASKLLTCVFDSNTNRSDIYILDTSNKTEPFKPLVNDGKSCNPSWR